MSHTQSLNYTEGLCAPPLLFEFPLADRAFTLIRVWGFSLRTRKELHPWTS